MEWAIYALYAIVAGLAIYAAGAMKAPKTKPASLDEFNIPTAEEGREYPVLYGTDWFTDPNVIWYGDLGVETETEDHIKTRKYSLGMHIEFMQGQPDALLELRADDRTYFEGEVTESSQIYIDMGSLFGGKRERGGIVGYIDVLFGEEDQQVNDYLASKITGPLSAMRGVAGLVFRQVYLTANSPYVAPHSARWSRIFNGWYNDECWYPETAAVYCCGETPTWRVTLLAHFDGNFDDDSQDERILVPDGDAGIGSGPWIDGTWSSFGSGSVRSDGQYHDDIGNALIIIPGANADDGSFSGMFCIEGDIKITLHGDQCWFGFNDRTTVSGQSLTIETNAAGYPLFRLFNGFTGYNTTVVGDFPLSLDTKYQIAVTRDEDNIVRLFVEGQKQSNTLFSTALIAGDVGRYVILGRINSGYYINVANGKVDNVRFTRDLVRYTDDYTIQETAFIDDSIDLSEACVPDMNPAHVFYDVITNPFRGMGRPIVDINDASFRAAAVIFKDECFGITTKWNRQGPTSEFMKALEEVTDSVCDIDPIDGLWYLTPIRGNYNVDDLPVFDENNIIRIEDFNAHGYGNIVSRVIVNYKDPDTAKPATSPPWDNPATYGAQGGRLTIEEFEAPQVRRHDLAKRIAEREGMKKTHELRAFTVIANRDGYAQRRGGVIVVSWNKLGLELVVCRIIAINYGNLKNREIKMAVIEDVYGLPESSYTEVTTSQWEEPSFDAEPIDIQTAMELPRWYLRQALGEANVVALPDDAGFGQAIGVRPSGLATGYDLWHQLNSGGYTSESIDDDFARTALLNGAITGEDTSLVIDGSSLIVSVVGDLLQIGEGDEAEIIRLVGGNLTTGLEVTRGHLDTTPKSWPDNTRIYRLPEDGELQDDDEYADYDIVDYKLLTTTSQDILAIGDALATSVQMRSRQIRPIAPGDIQINGEAFPSFIDVPFTLTWENRNRVTHIDTTLQTSSGIAGEAGVTYDWYAYDDDTDAELDSLLGTSGNNWIPSVIANCTVRLEGWSVRDGYASWQPQIRVFDYLTTEALITQDEEFLLTQDGELLQEQ